VGGAGKKEIHYEFFGGEARRKESLARSRRSKEDFIKIHFKGTE